jgi:hypothetical protein
MLQYHTVGSFWDLRRTLEVMLPDDVWHFELTLPYVTVILGKLIVVHLVSKCPRSVDVHSSCLLLREPAIVTRLSEMNPLRAVPPTFTKSRVYVVLRALRESPECFLFLWVF